MGYIVRLSYARGSQADALLDFKTIPALPCSKATLLMNHPHFQMFQVCLKGKVCICKESHFHNNTGTSKDMPPIHLSAGAYIIANPTTPQSPSAVAPLRVNMDALQRRMEMMGQMGTQFL